MGLRQFTRTFTAEWIEKGSRNSGRPPEDRIEHERECMKKKRNLMAENIYGPAYVLSKTGSKREQARAPTRKQRY
jgi:hypothetical protein